MSPAIGRVLLEPQKNSSRRPVVRSTTKKDCAILTAGLRLRAASGDLLELLGGRIVVGNDRVLVAHVERLGAAGQRQNVDLRAEFDDPVLGLGNPVGSRRYEALIDGVTLGEQLQAFEKARPSRKLRELLVGAELGGRKLVKIDRG